MSREEVGALFSRTNTKPRKEGSSMLHHEQYTLWERRQQNRALRKLNPIMDTTLYGGIDRSTWSLTTSTTRLGISLHGPHSHPQRWKRALHMNSWRGQHSQSSLRSTDTLLNTLYMPFSNFPNEKEILLEPETTSYVKSIQCDAKNPKSETHYCICSINITHDQRGR